MNASSTGVEIWEIREEPNVPISSCPFTQNHGAINTHITISLFSALFWSPPSSHKIGIKLLPIYIILIIYVCVVFLCLCKETQQHFDVFLFFKLLLLYVQYFCPLVKNQWNLRLSKVPSVFILFYFIFCCCCFLFGNWKSAWL